MEPWLNFVSVFSLLLPAILAAVLAILGFLCRQPRLVGLYCRAAEVASLLGFVSALTIGLLVWWNGPIDQVLWHAQAPFSLGVYVDPLSCIMLLLTATIGFVVTRYSFRYLDGSPDQARFVAWIQFTLFAVFSLLCSRNLVWFVLFWGAVSFGLHRLLLFFPHRPAARRAAWKKFVISRIGDGCLVGGMFLTYRIFGTLEFPDLFRVASSTSAGTEVSLMAFLFVLGAMTKSAQFPFHTWLPETMETPTPVSALMHAGIINAGGYLIVRLSPLVSQSPLALDLLLINGAITAFLGSVMMLTATDIKRSLAYSTIGQMGFMMMQCGLGAFAAAVLHIVAHGLYKAHAFLNAGSVLQSRKRADPALQPGWALVMGSVSLIASLGIVSVAQQIAGIELLHKAGGAVIATFLIAGIASYLYPSLAGTRLTLVQKMIVAATGLSLVLGYFMAWKVFQAALLPFVELSGSFTHTTTTVGKVFIGVMIPVTVLVLVLHWVGSSFLQSRLGYHAYLLMRNGIYLTDLLRGPSARARLLTISPK